MILSFSGIVASGPLYDLPGSTECPGISDHATGSSLATGVTYNKKKGSVGGITEFVPLKEPLPPEEARLCLAMK